MRMHDGQLALPSPSTQPVSGDIQVESTHHVVVLLAAAVVVDRGVLVGGLAELVPATTVRVMTTAATKPSLRTGHSYTTGACRRAVGFGHQQHRPPVTFPNTCRQSQILAVGPPTRTRTSLSRYGVRALGQSQQKRPTGTSAWSSTGLAGSRRQSGQTDQNLEDFAPSMWFTGVCLNAMKRDLPGVNIGFSSEPAPRRPPHHVASWT